MAESVDVKIARLEVQLKHNTRLTTEMHAALCGEKDAAGLKGRVRVLEVKMRGVLSVLSLGLIPLVRLGWQRLMRTG